MSCTNAGEYYVTRGKHNDVAHRINVSTSMPIDMVALHASDVEDSDFFG